MQLASSLPERIAHPYMFDTRYRRKLLPLSQTPNGSGSRGEAYKTALCTPNHSLLQQAMRVDFGTYLPDDLLVKVDRASMLNSLETRAPWLDHRILEFAFGRVPDRFKIANNERKILLRKLAQKILPRSLDLHRKQGFSIPLTSWINGEWGGFFESVLRGCKLFDRRTIDELLANQRKGYANTDRLFLLVMFELWQREYRVTA